MSDIDWAGTGEAMDPDNRHWAVPSAEGPFVDRRAAQQPAATPDLLAGLHNGTWLDAQTFPPLQYAVPGLLAEGFALLAGAPKIGKSWLALDWGLARAAGGYALGKIDVGRARPVFYLALEDGDRRLQERCRELLGHDATPPGFEYMTRVAPGRVVDTIAAWLAVHGADRPLVILDTWGRACPAALAGEAPYQRDYRIGSQLKAIVDTYPGATLLVNHHARKAEAADFVDAVSGTQGLAGAADSVLVLRRVRTSTAGLLQVTGRDVVEGEYALSFTNGVWALDGEDLHHAAANARARKVNDGLGETSSRILSVVENHPEGIAPAKVAAEAGMDDGNAVGVYLRRLEKAGRIESPRRGHYTPLPTPPVLSVSVFENGDGAWEGDDSA